MFWFVLISGVLAGGASGAMAPQALSIGAPKWSEEGRQNEVWGEGGAKESVHKKIICGHEKGARWCKMWGGRRQTEEKPKGSHLDETL